MAAGICGSDISGFLGHSRRRIPPLVLGHEFVGRSPRRQARRRQSAHQLRTLHCLSEWRAKPLRQLATAGHRSYGWLLRRVRLRSRIPDLRDPRELSDARAVLAEPLANIVHLFRIAAPLPFFRMGIVGGGTMGSLALLVAMRLGVREMIVQDVSEVRLDVARRMGATLAANVSTEDRPRRSPQLRRPGPRPRPRCQRHRSCASSRVRSLPARRTGRSCSA